MITSVVMETGATGNEAHIHTPVGRLGWPTMIEIHSSKNRKHDNYIYNKKRNNDHCHTHLHLLQRARLVCGSAASSGNS